MDLLKIENQLNQKITKLEDYGMFVSPEENAFWSKMDDLLTLLHLIYIQIYIGS